MKDNPFLKTLENPAAAVSPKAEDSVNVTLQKNHEFTEGEALHFEIRLREGERLRTLKKGNLNHPAAKLPLVFNLGKAAEGESILEVDLDISYCTNQAPKLCKFKSLKLIQPVSFAAAGKSKLELTPSVEP